MILKYIRTISLSVNSTLEWEAFQPGRKSLGERSWHALETGLHMPWRQVSACLRDRFQHPSETGEAVQQFPVVTNVETGELCLWGKPK